MAKILSFKIPRYKKNGLLKVNVQQPKPGKVVLFQPSIAEPEPIYCPGCGQLARDEETKRKALKTQKLYVDMNDFLDNLDRRERCSRKRN